MTSYSLFRQGGCHFAYHLGAGRFIRVSPEAYDLLERRLNPSLPGSDKTEPGASTAYAGALADIAKLEAEGFFEPVETAFPDDEEFAAEFEKRYSGRLNRLVLSVSSRCNLACRYCYCGICRDEISGGGTMDEETAMRAVDGLFAAADPSSDIRVTFFGGEPLLAKALIRKVVERCNAWAGEHGVSAGYSITTNATLMDEETAKLIADNNFGLMVSLDGPQALHDSQCPTRSGEGSYASAVEGIRLLKKYRRKVTVRCTMAHPAPDAMALIRFFEDFGFTRIVLGTVSNPAFPSECDFTPEDHAAFARTMQEEIIPWMLQRRAGGLENLYDPFEDIDGFQSEKKHPAKIPALRCGACHGAMAVGPDGTLYPCHRFVGMEAWKMGTLDSGPDIGKCREFWRSYRAAVRGKCSGCWAQRVCKGPCPWEVAAADGRFVGPERICDETKTWIRQGVYYLNKVGELGLDSKKENENDYTQGIHR